jgi:hypothetical protein
MNVTLFKELKIISIHFCTESVRNMQNLEKHVVKTCAQGIMKELVFLLVLYFELTLSFSEQFGAKLITISPALSSFVENMQGTWNSEPQPCSTLCLVGRNCALLS